MNNNFSLFFFALLCGCSLIDKLDPKPDPSEYSFEYYSEAQTKEDPDSIPSAAEKGVIEILNKHGRLIFGNN